MKKTLKRWGALLLAAVMTLSLLPTAALAASGEASSGAIAADDASRDIPVGNYTLEVDSSITDGSTGPKEKATDGNEGTWWHSNNTPPAGGHWISVELSEAKWVSAFRYKPRADYTSANSNASATTNGNGYVTRYAVYVSQNGTDWGDPVAQGEWNAFDSNNIPTGAWQVANFTPVRAKFIKLVGVCCAGNGNANNQYMHAAEIRVVAALEQPDQVYSVSGTVVDADGNPLSGAAVAIAGQRDTTDANGAYTIANLAPGAHTATVTLAGYELVSGAEVTVEDGNVTDHTFRMQAVDRAITGTVTSGGTALEGAAVTLVQNNDTYTTVTGPAALTGANGSYTLSVNGVSAGSYRVRVSKAGYETALSAPVDVTTASPQGTFPAGEVSISAITDVTYPYDMSDASHTPTYTAGNSTSVRVQNNGLVMDFNGTSRENDQVRLNGINFQDAVVEFDATRSGTGSGNGLGVALRWEDDSNCFFVGRNSAGKWYSESVSGGTASQSGAVTGPSFNSGETRHFKLRIRQDGDAAKVSLWIDGVPVIDDVQAGDGQGPVTPGRLAFVCGSNNTSVTVRDLYITVEDPAYTITMPDTLAGYVVISGAQDKALTEGGGIPESGMKCYTAHAGDVVNIYSASLAQNEMSAPLKVHRTEDGSISSTENILRMPTASSAHRERGSYIQFRMPAYDVTLEPTLTPVQADEDEVTSVMILRSGDPGIPEIVGVGKTAKLDAVIVPGLETELTWSSSDESVVRVEGPTESNPDESGRIATATAAVTGVSAGTATITVTTANGKTDTRQVTVGTPVSDVSFQTTSTVTLYTNGQPGTATLTATVEPANATNQTLKWTSSNETVATVDQDGVVTAVAPGTARITAISQQNTGASAYRDVTVVTRPERLMLDTGHLDMTVDVGDSAHERVVKATLSPEGTSDKTIDWSTSDAAVATVTKPAQWQELGIQDAIVTGVKPGTATITARSAADNTITATMTVTVTQKITGQVSITGALKFGSTLTANISTYEQEARPQLTYQWYRGAEATEAAAIPGATQSTYTPVKEDIGQVLTVKVSCKPDSYYRGGSIFTTAAVITKEDGHEVNEANLTYKNCSSETAKDGEIQGLLAGHVYQYQKQNADGSWPTDEESWIDVDENAAAITGLAPGSYRIRHIGDDTREPGTPSNTITISVVGTTEVALTVPQRFEGGVVRANRSQVPAGDTVTLTVTPDEGYELATLEAAYTDGNGEEQTLLPTQQSDGKYTFTMPAFPVAVAATFRLKTYTIGHELTNISCSLGAEAGHTATYGEAFTITLTPTDGYTMPRTLTLTETDTGKAFDDYTYEVDSADPAKRVLTFENGVTCNISVSGEGVPITCAISYVPERVRFVTAPRQVGWHQGLIVTMTPEVGYQLPETIAITMGGAALTAGEDYTYNSTSGVVTIHEGVITGVLEIRARGERIVTPLDKVSISGVAQVGQRLTVNITPAEADGHVAYQWYWVEGDVETLIDYATGRTQVLTEASLGKTIVVKADALPGGGFSGAVVSQPTGIVIAADETKVMPQWVEIQRDRIDLNVGDTDTIVARVGPSSATDKTVLWSSSNEAVVRVENGVITAVSPGTATITVTAEADRSVTDTCRVTVAETRNVVAEAGDVSVTYDGKAHGITVTVTNPAAGNATITYSSDGVHYSGTKPTFSAAGEHTVWYQVGSVGMVSFQSQAKVIISKAAPEISVSADHDALTQAGDVTITITVPDYADPDGISLEADDLMIPITRNEDGTYTAQLPAAEKTYTFTVTLRPTDNYDGASASYSVTVKRNDPVRPVPSDDAVVIRPVTTTEIREDPDGSVITTETDTATGVVTETTRRPDGTKVEKITAPGKGVEITVTDDKGEVVAEVRIPADIPAPATRFVDVPEGHWADAAIHEMAALEIVNGVGGDRFDMSSSMTRGALATILSRMSNGQKGLDSGFDDVAPGQWYVDGIAWAAKNGIVTGYSASSFGPNDAITREQLAVMLCRYAHLLGMDTSADSYVLDSFTDGGLTHDWAAESVSWCVVNGILQGKGNATLASTATATRAEVAVMLQRFIDLMK